MHEYHGWFGIAESTEESDTGTLKEGIADLRRRLADPKWSSNWADVLGLNGEYFLVLNGLVNRLRGEATDVYELLEFVAARFPGSYGLLYERADEMPVPPGHGAFRVHRMARGRVDIRLDPFLSPANPVIED